MIKKFIKKFFQQVEATPVLPPSEDELVDGQAFAIKHYPLSRPVYLMPGDRLRATLHDEKEGMDQTVEENIESKLYVDTISTVRFNDALGYKHAIGALFGQRK